ncbi:MAG TPA: pilus assembly protein PilM [Vicinamibacterales bacterium]|nr:pilus assembly protein PilM [Vicinamibacterales bacterium]
MPAESSWFAPTPPTIAVELASRRLTVVELGRGASSPLVGYASEPLPPGALSPAPSGPNIQNPSAVLEALKRGLDRAGVRKSARVALVIPDNAARVSLLPFEQLPSKSADVDQLIRWKLKKSTPFPIEDAQIAWFVAHKSETGPMVAATVARRDVVAQYESVATAAGLHAGIVDVASFNVMNAVIGAGGAPASDWLLVTLAPEATTLTIGRGSDLMFYRHRAAVEEEGLSALVHQTAMFHEDRLGGTKFSRVWLCGGGLGTGADDVRREIRDRLNVPVEVVDVRQASEMGSKINASTDVLDALAAPIGALLRDRKAA